MPSQIERLPNKRLKSVEMWVQVSLVVKMLVQVSLVAKVQILRVMILPSAGRKGVAAVKIVWIAMIVTTRTIRGRKKKYSAVQNRDEDGEGKKQKKRKVNLTSKSTGSCSSRNKQQKRKGKVVQKGREKSCKG